MRQKCLKILLVLVTCWTCSEAQIIKPRHWSWNAVQVNGDIYDLVFTMKIDTPWHGYSQYIVSDEGPLPTTISIEQNDDVELIGKITESGPDVQMIDDVVIGMKLKWFNKAAIFTQRIKLKRPTVIKGYVEAMICNSNTALAPERKDFSMKVGSVKKVRMVVEK